MSNENIKPTLPPGVERVKLERENSYWAAYKLEGSENICLTLWEDSYDATVTLTPEEACIIGETLIAYAMSLDPNIQSTDSGDEPRAVATIGEPVEVAEQLRRITIAEERRILEMLEN